VKKLRDQIGQAVLDIREAWKREGLDVERLYKVAVSIAPIRWTNACRGAVDRGTESSGGSSLGRALYSSCRRSDADGHL
jgi:hypothetical protein